MPSSNMHGVLHIFVSDMIDEPVLGYVQRAIGQVLAGAENPEVVDQEFQILEERLVELLVFLQVREFMFAHECLFSPKVPCGVIPEKRDGLFDSMFAFAVEDLVIQSMCGLKKTSVLLVDLCNAREIIVRPVSNHVTPFLRRLQRTQADSGRGWESGPLEKA